MPHLRSRVMARSLRPSRIQAWVIWTALFAQKPSTLAFFIQDSSMGRMAGRSMYKCVVLLGRGVAPQVEQSDP